MIHVTRSRKIKAEAGPADDLLVGPELTSMPRTRACPACGAAGRVAADWCGQCYADLRPPPPPPPAAAPPVTPGVGAVYGVPVVDALQGPLQDLLPTTPYAAAAPDSPPPVAGPAAAAAEPTWPCLTCTRDNPLSATACSNCGSAFLAAVAHESRTTLVLPLVGDLGAMSRGKRLAVAGGLVAALLVPLAVLTLLLTQSPPDSSTTTPPGTTVISTP